MNNAGLALGTDRVGSIQLDELDAMLETNVRGLIHMTQVFVPRFKERGSGHIINIGSIAGLEAYPGGSVYCATKFAVRAFTSALMKELYETPIRVSNIQPGMVETEFSLVRYRGDADSAGRVYTGIEALTSEDIAEEIVWTASHPPHVNVAEVRRRARVAHADDRPARAPGRALPCEAVYIGSSVAVQHAPTCSDATRHTSVLCDRRRMLWRRTRPSSAGCMCLRQCHGAARTLQSALRARRADACAIRPACAAGARLYGTRPRHAAGAVAQAPRATLGARGAAYAHAPRTPSPQAWRARTSGANTRASSRRCGGQGSRFPVSVPAATHLLGQRALNVHVAPLLQHAAAQASRALRSHRIVRVRHAEPAPPHV